MIHTYSRKISKVSHAYFIVYSIYRASTTLSALQTPLNVKAITSPLIKPNSVSGYMTAKSPLLNKGHSFSLDEREKLGIKGLVPAGEPLSMEIKLEIAMEQLRKKSSPLEKYIYLHTIQDSDETLFYAILVNHTFETLPYVYTPTVGQACQEWSSIYRHTPRGLYLSIKDKGQIRYYKLYTYHTIKLNFIFLILSSYFLLKNENFL